MLIFHIREIGGQLLIFIDLLRRKYVSGIRVADKAAFLDIQVLLSVLCSPKGEHIVAALSLRPSVRLSVRHISLKK